MTTSITTRVPTTRLREARTIAGLTSGQAAKIFKSTDTGAGLVYSKMESFLNDVAAARGHGTVGEILSSLGILWQLAELFSVSTCWLRGHDGQVVPDDVGRALNDFAKKESATEDFSSSAIEQDIGEVVGFVARLGRCADCADNREHEGQDPTTT